MAIFRRKKTITLQAVKRSEIEASLAAIPEDLASRCPRCQRILLQNQIDEDYCCPHCGEHLQFPAHERITWLVDKNSFQEWDREVAGSDPLNFPNYPQKIVQKQEETSLNEAVITGQARLDGRPLAIGVMDNRFIMASMGQVVGEKLSRLFEEATRLRLGVILYIASGGARMQEGIYSLMQMAKVTQAVTKHAEAGLFYCAILTHPTTGGVTASFAMQADLTLAEPHAIIGFAGKRVIEQTIKAKLAKDFQSAEWVYENGYIDQIVSRQAQREVLSQMILIHQDRGDD